MLEKNKNSARLAGWKAIGQFLGCTARTARRWEAHRGMPVHRIPGGSRASVWASADELTSWLQALPGEVQAVLRAESDAVVAPQTPDAVAVSPAATPVAVTAAAGEALAPPAPQAAPPRRRVSAAVAVAVTALALVSGVALLWVKRPVAASAPVAALTRTPYDDNREARDAYLNSRFELEQRTVESLLAAEKGFRELVERYPDRAAGWSGLADTYLLQREFGALRDEEAYPRAARAARTAVALDPKLPSAWLDEAFVAWWWQGDAATAFHAFETSLALDPSSAQGYHWYATALWAHGETARALQAIAHARTLDPASRAIVADEAWIRFGSGQPEAGLATLERLSRLDPKFESWHHYLAVAYLVLGRDADFLREARLAAELRGRADLVADLDAAAARYGEGGHAALLTQLSASAASDFEHGAGSAAAVAAYRALAGDRDGMLRWLGIAQVQHDHNLPSVRAYPEFAAYRSDPAFQRIISQLP